jgi:hypothetical protein
VTMKLSSGVTCTSPYAIQYWWTNTITFVHNWNISIFLFLDLVAICTVFTMTAISLTTKVDSFNSRTSTPTPVIYCLFAHLINMVIVTAVNMLTVIGTVSSIALFGIQTVLVVFKLAWSSWAIPRLLLRAKIADNQKLSHWTFMVVFVFLGAPFASSFCESSSCFLYVLTKVEAYSLCSGSQCTVVLVSSDQLVHSSIPAPWVYSYQCSLR